MADRPAATAPRHERAAHVGIIRAVLAAWIPRWRSASAAGVLRRTSSNTTVLTLLLTSLLCGVFVGGLTTLVSAHESFLGWRAVTSGDGQVVTKRLDIRWSALRSAWNRVRATEPWPDDAIVALSGFLLSFAVIALVARFNVTRVARDEPGGTAYRLALQATLSTTGLPLAGLFLIGLAVTAYQHLAHGLRLFNEREEHFVCFVVAGAITACIWVWRSGVASLALRGPDLPPRAPRCEFCGYDLTASLEADRCPECGEHVSLSCGPNALRFGWEWETAPRTSFVDWAGLSLGLLLQPGNFYRRLHMTGSLDAARRFAGLHYAMIGAIAAGWAALSMMLELLSRVAGESAELLDSVAVCFAALAVALSLASVCWSNGRIRLFYVAAIPAGVLLLASLSRFGISSRSTFDETLIVPIIAGLIAPLACWFGHRLVGAIVAAGWLRWRSLPDAGWIEKITAYESCFLWVFCTTWGLLIWSFIVGGMWLSDLGLGSASYAFLGIQAEPGAVIVATLALGMVWLWRYGAALRDVRWANC